MVGSDGEPLERAAQATAHVYQGKVLGEKKELIVLKIIFEVNNALVAVATSQPFVFDHYNNSEHPYTVSEF